MQYAQPIGYVAIFVFNDCICTKQKFMTKVSDDSPILNLDGRTSIMDAPNHKNDVYSQMYHGIQQIPKAPT